MESNVWIQTKINYWIEEQVFYDFKVNNSIIYSLYGYKYSETKDAYKDFLESIARLFTNDMLTNYRNKYVLFRLNKRISLFAAKWIISSIAYKLRNRFEVHLKTKCFSKDTATDTIPNRKTLLKTFTQSLKSKDKVYFDWEAYSELLNVNFAKANAIKTNNVDALKQGSNFNENYFYNIVQGLRENKFFNLTALEFNEILFVKEKHNPIAWTGSVEDLFFFMKSMQKTKIITQTNIQNFISKTFTINGKYVEINNKKYNNLSVSKHIFLNENLISNCKTYNEKIYHIFKNSGIFEKLK